MKIHTYAAEGNIEGVAQELAQGIPIDTLEDSAPNHYTPLMCAIASPAAPLEMVRFLVEQGANVNAVSYDRLESEQNVLEVAIKRGSLDKIKFLLDADADINYQRPSGYDVLIDVMYRIQLIGEENASLETTPDQPDNYELEDYELDSEENLLPIMRLLIERGAPLNGTSEYNESAMSIACDRGNFEIIRLLLESGATPQPLEWTELMHAIALGSLQDVQRCLSEGADLSARDYWSRTPWLLSLQTGDLDKAKLLLTSGADRSDKGHCDKTPLMYPIEKGHHHILQWLLEEGFDTEATNEFGETALMIAAEKGDAEGVRLLLGAGARLDPQDHIDKRAISRASTVEIARMLIDAEEDINDIDDYVRAALTGRTYDGELQTTKEDYIQGKHRRFGKANPELMDIPFWKAMVRCGVSAYTARDAFDDTGDYSNPPVWCFDRFGKSITELPDGRFIEIAGEHEDYYMPDFCIYNDVIVHHGAGKFDIFGYPEEIFPCTDFHTSTLVGNQIYIIGNLGYIEQRGSGETPIYCLNCETFAISKVETTGENPGWISRHKALCKEGQEIHISGGDLWAEVNGENEYFENPHRYVLDLATMKWRCVKD